MMPRKTVKFSQKRTAVPPIVLNETILGLSRAIF